MAKRANCRSVHMPWVKIQVLPPVNIPSPTKTDQNGWCSYSKMVPLVLTHSHMYFSTFTGRKLKSTVLHGSMYQSFFKDEQEQASKHRLPMIQTSAKPSVSSDMKYRRNGKLQGIHGSWPVVIASKQLVGQMCG